ncbi:6-hydroxymethylpterin diphosphokinase MptE-like protein [Clostridium sp.]|uniref:motility associated factor glycosyltransferase family protein n=1 Tax=Clostridium sp. TaxID=1506 RepID=UPI002637CCDE|nr:6-hydroxymethylpterin diphosphokinase MptE-like protein [Clostridium sp.]
MSKYNINIEKSKDDKDIIKVISLDKVLYLGSKYSVNRDINNLKKFINENNDINIVIIGLSTGEYIDEIRECVKDNNILIIEPCKEIYDLYLLKEKEEKENIIVLPLLDEYKDLISTHIKKFALDGFKTYEYTNYKNIFTEEVSNTYKLIRDVTRKSIIFRNTEIFFSKLWFESTVSNLKHLYKSKKINNFKEIYKNRPAIIVSAGPSLSKNIKEIKKLEDKAVIFTGGRTLKALFNEGINPDFLSIIDAHELSYELVEGIIENNNTTLVHSEILPSNVINKHKGEKIFFSGMPWIRNLINDHNYNFTYSSVAHTCTKIAMYMGCNPIIFVGQDLAYTDDKVHADNAKFTQEKYKDKEDINKIKNDSDIYVNDIYGNEIRTSATLDLFRQQFEEIIDENKEFEFINSTEGGANIKGTKVKKLIDNIERLERLDKKKEIDINYEGVDIALTKEEINNIFDKSVEYLEKLISKLKEATKQNEKYYNYYISNNKILKSALKILDQADKLMKEIPNEVKFIGYLFSETINIVLYNPKYKLRYNDSELTKAKKIYQKSKILYGNVLKEATYALKYINDNREEL